MHRDYDDIWWQADPAKHTQWTDWDYALAEAYRTKENFTDPATGQPLWLAEDPEVYWELGHRKSHAAADLHKAQQEVGDEPGHTVFLKNPTKDGEFWTIEDWLDYSDESDGQILERGAPEGARPPTPEELTEMREKRRRAAAEAEPIE